MHGFAASTIRDGSFAVCIQTTCCAQVRHLDDSAEHVSPQYAFPTPTASHPHPSSPCLWRLVHHFVVLRPSFQYEESDVTDQMDLLRAQAKGQEFDEAKAQDKIEAQLEREMVRDAYNAHAKRERERRSRYVRVCRAIFQAMKQIRSVDRTNQYC